MARVCDHVVQVTSGSVDSASWKTSGRNIRWLITETPDRERYHTGLPAIRQVVRRPGAELRDQRDRRGNTDGNHGRTVRIMPADGDQSSPGHQVSLNAQGTSSIIILVQADDGSGSTAYYVDVTIGT